MKATKSIGGSLYLIALSLIAVIGIYGYFGSVEDRGELETIAEIEKLGGSVDFDERSPDTPAVAVNFSRTSDTDAGLVPLKGLPELRTVNLSSTQVTDAGLIHLKGLRELISLGLADTQVTDAGLVHLKGLLELRMLSLSNTRVTDAGLTHLEGLTNLDYVHLAGTRVTDDGVEHLNKALPDCKFFR